jgi:hypothetical protein
MSKEQGMSVIVAHPRRALIAAFAILATAVALFAATDRADAATKCPATFRVLHNDHIGKLNLPAGTYVITTKNENKISCQRASDLFTKFLQDYDGKLPNGWKVLVDKSGFRKTAQKAFFVKRQGGGGGGGGRHPGKGEKICPGTFQVQHNDHIGKLRLPKGPYKITVINKRKISCSRASQLFAKFLQRPSGNLPSGWKLEVQSATFKKVGKHKGFRVKQA